MRYLTAILLMLFLTGTAYAHQCPSLMNKIDSQLQSAQLDNATASEVRALRDKGETLHKQGKHGESVKVLNEALAKLRPVS